jgi:hypothetical protein
LKGLYRFFIPPSNLKLLPFEKGYIYFQDFVPDNYFDTRIIVIGKRAFAIRRKVRENDFRASGSGNFDYDHSAVDIRCVKIAFEVTNRLLAKCLTFDFVVLDNEPKIIEMSFGFLQKVYDPCPGYWNENLEWHPGKIEPQHWMVDAVLRDELSNAS